MDPIFVARIIFSLIAVAISVGPMVADFNKTHATNPLWDTARALPRCLAGAHSSGRIDHHTGAALDAGARPVNPHLDCGLPALCLVYRLLCDTWINEPV